MLRTNSRGINKLRRGGSSGGAKRTKGGCSYEKMMKTLLLQNQQIIIQQQNMMFMVIKQFQHQNSASPLQQQQPTTSTTNGTANNSQHQHDQQQQHHHQHHHHHPMSSSGHQQQQQHLVALHHSHQPQQQQAGPQQLQQQSQQQQQNLSQQIHSTPATPASSQQPATPASQSQTSHILHHHPQAHDEHSIQQHHYFSHHQAGTPTPGPLDTQQQLQQVANQLQENLGNYLTPAQSEQDPISENKQEEEDFQALMNSDLLGNNLLYNPTTDIGSVTPYKNLQQQQTPSCYSSGCESLTTPRVEQPRQPTTANISQNVVKNLADSFKSPTKPKINVQILSGSETMSMKNNKAKIIQRMNISEFLRQVHHDDGQKSSI